MAIAHLAADDPRWRADLDADWVYADDHRWDRERGAATLPAMLGLPMSVATEGDGAPGTTGSEQSLIDYARVCNAHAEEAGLERRLHGIDADELVLVCLSPVAFRALVKGEYLTSSEETDS